MKAKITKTITILLSLSIILSVNAQQIDLGTHKSTYRNKSFSENYVYDSNMQKYNVVYQHLYFSVNPSIYYVNGKTSILYSALENLDSLIINLSDSLQIDSITQRNNLLSYNHQDNLIRIDIDDITINSLDSVKIYYQGQPSKRNSAFFIGVQDSTNYIPVLATLSEPYGSSDWWPCKNNLDDKIDSIDISITCPINNKAISVGLLSSVESSSTENTFHWKHRYPIAPYLVSIAVSNYYEYHSYLSYNNNDSILFLNYLYQNNLTTKKNNIDLTESFFQVFDSLFIPYPFNQEKYGHVEFPVGGGMEHQTISSMGKFDYEIISHELAHQWFGDYITCDSWLDLWLNEGFATYCTGLCYENLQNGHWWPIWKELTVSKITEDSTGSVFPIDTNDLSVLFSSRLTYRKAAYLLHMIRWTIGDDIFFQALKNYLNDTELNFSFATTTNLIAHFEQKADTSLSNFMSDWFYGEGYPIYNIEWSQNENNNFYIQLNQESALNDNHFFKLFVPIRLIGINDTLDIKLNHQSNHQTYTFNLDFSVDTIIFDPDFWLISKNSTTEVSIDEINNRKIEIFPNPFQSSLYINSNSPINKIEIINLSGEIVETFFQRNISSLRNLPSGLYFIKIETNNSQFIKKVIKN